MNNKNALALPNRKKSGQNRTRLGVKLPRLTGRIEKEGGTTAAAPPSTEPQPSKRLQRPALAVFVVQEFVRRRFVGELHGGAVPEELLARHADGDVAQQD